jgi:hypothetical protein
MLCGALGDASRSTWCSAEYSLGISGVEDHDSTESDPSEMLEHFWAEIVCPPCLPHYKSCTSGTCRHSGLSTCGTHWGKEKCIRGCGGGG